MKHFFSTLALGVAFGLAFASWPDGPHQLFFAWSAIYEGVIAAAFFFFWPTIK